MELGGSLPKSFRFRLKGEGNNCLNCSLNLPEYRCIYPQGAEKETEGKGLTFVQQTFFCLCGTVGEVASPLSGMTGPLGPMSCTASLLWAADVARASHCVDLSIGTLPRHMRRADLSSASYP